MLKKKNKKGFTIVELVIVIAVIGILAAILVPLFSGLISKANLSSDGVLLRELNNAITMDAEQHGKHETIKDALKATDEYGFNVQRINAKVSENRILWDSKNDVFCYLKDGVVEYHSVSVEEAEKLSAGDYRLWAISNDVDEEYSTYLYKYTGDGVILTNKGLDVGAEEVNQITYAHSGEAQEVVIRTNSASTTLIINDASTGTIYHYGSAGELNIIQCHTGSYHENGNVAFAEVAKGRIVLENDSEIKHIHVNANENANGFDTVIIADNGAVALPEAITRDKVDVTEAKPVVTVETGVSSETVYVYPYTDAQESKTGTTEQTATQNTSIASALGKLVLDNGSDAGEKAMSNNEKTEAKTELVNEAKAPEIAKEFEDETTAVVYNMTTGEYYDNLYSAIEEVPENTKTTLVLLKNITGISNKNYEISKNKDIVLDLNGKVLNTVAPDESVAYTVINFGTLRIKDNTDRSLNGSGTGKITSSAIRPDMQDVPGYASNTITNHGKLTIESGVIENKGKGYACFAIDNQTNGTLYTPELVINGGKMLQESAQHYAVRMFCNSTNNVNKVIVNGGIIEGGYAFWMQTPNNKANKAELVINGGEFIAHDGYAVYFGGSGSTTDGRQYSNTSIIINGGTLNRVMMGGVSSSEKAPASFEINGGRIAELALGSNISPIIRGGVYNSSIISTWGYVYIDNGDVYVENQDGSKGEKYDSPWDKKSYWEEQGYSFEYDSNYKDYVVKYERSINDIISNYLDDNYQLVDNGNGTSSVVRK